MVSEKAKPVRKTCRSKAAGSSVTNTITLVPFATDAFATDATSVHTIVHDDLGAPSFFVHVTKLPGIFFLVDLNQVLVSRCV